MLSKLVIILFTIEVYFLITKELYYAGLKGILSPSDYLVEGDNDTFSLANLKQEKVSKTIGSSRVHVVLLP